MIRSNLEYLDEEAPCFGVVPRVDGAVCLVFPVGGGLWGDPSDGEADHTAVVIGGSRLAIEIVGPVILPGQLRITRFASAEPAGASGNAEGECADRVDT
jgi:hypothetical protein